MWQARSDRGEVWQMGTRRDPDRSALAAFAEELRAQRDQAGLSRDELAGRVNYSASLISMIESGHRSPSRDFAARCDEALAAPGTFARLEARLRDVPFSSGFCPFQPYENQAAALHLFEHSLVPGLLQTEAYARAVLETHPNTPGRRGRGAGRGAAGPAAGPGPGRAAPRRCCGCCSMSTC